MLSTQVGGHSDLADMEIAVKLVERQNSEDLASPSLLELTAINQNGMSTASGLSDYDYENLGNLSFGSKDIQQVQTVNKIPIPSVVLEHFRSTSCHIEMGLFPEIGRAWLTIDSELYIWTYESVRDVAFYDGLNQIILGVGLVKPRANVFVKEVQYLLVLATPLEIAVLGVTFGNTSKTLSSPTRNGYIGGPETTTFEELQLVDRPIFILGTDNVNFRVIQGSDEGRIFLGGQDGCLYEIVYQADSGWFGKQCKKINHSKGIISSYMLPRLMKVFGDPDPIVQIVIDNTRHLLFTLTEKGCIEAWLIGEKNKDVQRIARVTEDEIAKRATSIIATVDIAVFKEIKSICVLTKEDSHQVHLIAVTHCGVRFYFSTTAFHNPYHHNQRLQPQIQQHQQQIDSSPNISSINSNDQSKLQKSQTTNDGEKTTPQGLYLLHIRLPPGYTSHIGVHKPKLVHTALYSEGTLLLVSTTAQKDQGTLLSLSAAPFPNRLYLTESVTLLPLDGLVWSMEPMRERSQSKLRSIIYQSRTPKKVMLLTNQGIHVIALLKPADILHQLLVACNGPHREPVKNFFQVQTPREACFACLLIICGETYRNTDVSMWAAQALLLYGGESSYQQQLTTPTSPMAAYMSPQMQSPPGRQFLNSPVMNAYQNPPNIPNQQIIMSTPFSSNANTPFGRMLSGMTSPISGNISQQQQMQSNLNAYSPITNQGRVLSNMGNPQMHSLIFSAKHDALYLYVARLLRPIWNMPCIRKDLSSSINYEDCANLLDELQAIRAFLDGNAINELSFASTTLHNQSLLASHGLGHVYTPNATNNNNNVTTQQDQQRVAEQAHNEEKRSLIGLLNFIKHTCEVIGFWKLLCEHRIFMVIGKLRKEQQESLQSCTFYDLVISSDTCAVLIVTLINSYLDDNATINSISAKLRDTCPTLYRHEDAISYKATELLRNSINCNNAEEKQERFLTALQLCKDAAPNLPLQHICQQFIHVGFYEGVIELASTCASKTDPEQYGIHYYNKGEPNEDRDGYDGYAARMVCYKEVRSMLDHIYHESGISNQTNVTMENNPYTSSNAMKTDPNAQIMLIVTLGIQINDPLLHITLYEWLLSHELLSELLGLTEPSLGEFLQRNVVRNPDNLQLVDLLWKYYEKNDQHAQAAQILDNLASMKSVSIPLEQRIEYLARAVMCMRNESVGYSVSNGILLKELEDKLEIARVQKCVQNAMSDLISTDPNATNVVNELNYMLYDITELYQNFADPFQLWECKLKILNCSQHNDQLLIESVWSHIINKAVEAAPGSSFERSVRLFTKMETLIREFGESGHCFPLAFLIRELEVKTCQLKFTEGIVPEKLIAMNLDIELLMEYYARMIAMNERVWANEGNEWHLVQSSIRLVTLLTKNVQTIWHRSKRRVFGKAQDIVSACLNLCYSKPGTDQLQHTLKELQYRLQRT